MITGRFTRSRKGRHPGGGQRVTVYSSTSLCLLHKAQNHSPVSTLELSTAGRVFDQSKPSTVQSGVLSLTEPGTYLVSDGVSLDPHTIFCPERWHPWTLSAHQCFFSAGERVSLRDKRELPLLSPFRVRGPMGSHGHPGVISHTARSADLLW